MPTALFILAFIRAGVLYVKEHIWGQPALEEPHMPKERRQETAVLSCGSRTLWCALKMPCFVVMTENGSIETPESRAGEMTFIREDTEI